MSNQTELGILVVLGVGLTVGGQNCEPDAGCMRMLKEYEKKKNCESGRLQNRERSKLETKHKDTPK